MNAVIGLVLALMIGQLLWAIGRQLVWYISVVSCALVICLIHMYALPLELCPTCLGIHIYQENHSGL